MVPKVPWYTGIMVPRHRGTQKPQIGVLLGYRYHTPDPGAVPPIRILLPPILRNFLPPTWQAHGFSPSCLLICADKFELILNFPPKAEHQYGSVQLWILIWQVRSARRLISLPLTEIYVAFRQCESLCGYYELKLLQNTLPKTEHSNCSSSQGTVIWFLRLFLRNFLLQREHADGFSPAWLLKCADRLDFKLNFLPQTEHNIRLVTSVRN